MPYQKQNKTTPYECREIRQSDPYDNSDALGFIIIIGAIIGLIFMMHSLEKPNQQNRDLYAAAIKECVENGGNPLSTELEPTYYGADALFCAREEQK